MEQAETRPAVWLLDCMTNDTLPAIAETFPPPPFPETTLTAKLVHVLFPVFQSSHRGAQDGRDGIDTMALGGRQQFARRDNQPHPSRFRRNLVAGLRMRTTHGTNVAAASCSVPALDVRDVASPWAVRPGGCGTVKSWRGGRCRALDWTAATPPKFRRPPARRSSMHLGTIGGSSRPTAQGRREGRAVMGR